MAKKELMLPDWTRNKAVYGVVLLVGVGALAYLLKRQLPLPTREDRADSRPRFRETSKPKVPFVPEEQYQAEPETTVNFLDTVPEPDELFEKDLSTSGTPPIGPPENVFVPLADTWKMGLG